ncbi:hypothetical protein [Mycolicibacterium frederiksbergense]|uniref:hypothetical protein n=1 Tax=Mycolicibacterium frederiksbergense TaxID=117567 RepID=UPI00399BB4B2
MAQNSAAPISPSSGCGINRQVATPSAVPRITQADDWRLVGQTPRIHSSPSRALVRLMAAPAARTGHCEELVEPKMTSAGAKPPTISQAAMNRDVATRAPRASRREVIQW